MIVTTQGVVIKSRNIGEIDRIVTILSKDFGVIELSARGVKRLRSNIASGTQLMCYTEFTLYKGRHGYSINSADVIESFYNLRLDVEKVSLAGYMCELANFMSPTNENATEFIRLMLNCFHLLAKDKADCAFIKVIFELRSISIAGFMPNLVCCKECHCYEAEKMLFLLVSGSLVCADCGNDIGQEKNCFIEVTPTILATMRHIVYADIEKLFRFSVNKNALAYLDRITESYLIVHTDRTFHSLDFYKSIRLNG